jgi:hypothetical protein
MPEKLILSGRLVHDASLSIVIGPAFVPKRTVHPLLKSTGGEIVPPKALNIGIGHVRFVNATIVEA